MPLIFEPGPLFLERSLKTEGLVLVVFRFANSLLRRSIRSLRLGQDAYKKKTTPSPA